MGTGFGMDVTSTTKLDVMDGVPTVVESPEIGYKNEKAFNPVTGSENLAPLSTEELFNQLDVAADDLQFVEIGTDTYLFWIQPGTTDQPARLEWKNLTDTSHYGTVLSLIHI